MEWQKAVSWRVSLVVTVILCLPYGTALGRGGGGGGHGGGGGGHGGGGHGGGGHGGSSHGGSSAAGHGGGARGQGGRQGRYGGYGLYGLGYGGFGYGYWPYGWGYGGYGYGSGYSSTSSGLAASYGSYGDPDDPYGYSYRYPRSGYTSAYAPPRPDNVAYVRLVVPQDAEVWFNDVKSTQLGRVREFTSPPLTPGKAYTYDLRAQWRENGKLVQRSRTLEIQPGAWTILDLTRP